LKFKNGLFLEKWDKMKAIIYLKKMNLSNRINSKIW